MPEEVVANCENNNTRGFLLLAVTQKCHARLVCVCVMSSRVGEHDVNAILIQIPRVRVSWVSRKTYVRIVPRTLW